MFPGGPPEPPYDLAGWTLPMQMGVNVDRVERRSRADGGRWTRRPAAGAGGGNAAFGYLLSAPENASYRRSRSCSSEGERVSRAGAGFAVGRERREPGTFVVHAGPATRERVERLARELGLEATGVARSPAAALQELRLPRIGLYRSWVAEIDEGWIRWVLDQYGIPYANLRDADLRAGDLSGYDVIVLPAQPADAMLDGHAPGSMPERYVGGIGRDGAATLRRFVEGGGRVVAIDGATDFVMEQFGLPVSNALRGLSTDEFFIPGSLLRMTVETDHPLAQGVPREVSGSFVTRRGSQSRAFAIAPGAEGSVEVVTRWAPDGLLLSGWALGEQEHLAGRPSMVRVGLGRGDVVLLGFRPQFRGQPRGTYKFLFNPMLRLDALQPAVPVGAGAAADGGWTPPGDAAMPW
jgi:hypothetical protein